MTDEDRRAHEAEARSRIVEAFANVERPGDWALVSSTEGEEPAAVVRELKGRGDWPSLDPGFLDQLPEGYGSALSFFSDEAFRHFLPAYMIADLDGKLRQCDPSFHLTHGLGDDSADERVNPRRYGDRTWRDVARAKFSTFTQGEARAIVGYLRCIASRDSFSRPVIEQALASYWHGRGGLDPGGGLAAATTRGGG